MTEIQIEECDLNMKIWNSNFIWFNHFRISSWIFNLNKMDLLKSQACIWMWLWDNLVHGILGPWDPGTFGLLDLFPPQPPPHIFSYLLLIPPVSSSWYGLVWYGLVKGVGGWVGGWVHLDFNISSGPLLSFDIWDWDWRWTMTQVWQILGRFLCHKCWIKDVYLQFVS